MHNLFGEKIPEDPLFDRCILDELNESCDQVYRDLLLLQCHAIVLSLCSDFKIQNMLMGLQNPSHVELCVLSLTPDTLERPKVVFSAEQ